MCTRIRILCADAQLRAELERRIGDGAEFVVCQQTERADAVVAAEPVLSPTQIEILQAYALTGSIQAVAARRGCSEQTVKNHLAAVRERLQVETTVQAVYWACCLGWIEPVYRPRDSTKVLKK